MVSVLVIADVCVDFQMNKDEGQDNWDSFEEISEK